MIDHAYVAFGSNTGDRMKNLGDLLRELGTRGLHMKRMANLYASNPADEVKGELFLNTVVEFKRNLTPYKFFEQLQRIELALGSPNQKSGSERTCDLDLLLWGEEIFEAPGIIVPHPRLAQRDFVLKPLCDLIPECELPGTKSTFFDLLERCPMTSIVNTVERHAP